MTVFEKLTSDIKNAMLAKNTVKRDCLKIIV
jgi:uncharacterized protein YqeY